MLDFDVVDVFSERPFAGNQLAVVLGGDQLRTEQCLALAREFNFSETTFPSAAVRAGEEYAVRIFTPGGEIPFAGHPTLGTAWVLRARGLLVGADVTQVCPAGRIGVRFAGNDVALAAAPRDLLGPLDDRLASDLLADVGLSASDLAGPAWVAGCGLSFVHLPVADGACRRAVPSRRPLASYADRFAALGPVRDPIEGIDVVEVSGTAPSLSVHARVFVPGLAVPEDPATGSAAVGLGMALVAGGWLPQGGRYTIRQGTEMGRPSVLAGRVETTVVGGDRGNLSVTDRAEARVAALCHVAGAVHPVARGKIATP